jgi:hypothetical protein
MRRAPQRGLACALVRINERTSAGTVGPPSGGRLFHVRRSLKTRRCQAMTASGFTMTSAVATRSRHVRARPRATGPSLPAAAVAAGYAAAPAAGAATPRPRAGARYANAQMLAGSEGKTRVSNHRPAAYPSTAVTHQSPQQEPTFPQAQAAAESIRQAKPLSMPYRARSA